MMNESKITLEPRPSLEEPYPPWLVRTAVGATSLALISSLIATNRKVAWVTRGIIFLMTLKVCHYEYSRYHRTRLRYRNFKQEPDALESWSKFPSWEKHLNEKAQPDGFSYPYHLCSLWQHDTMQAVMLVKTEEETAATVQFLLISPSNLKQISTGEELLKRGLMHIAPEGVDVVVAKPSDSLKEICEKLKFNSLQVDYTLSSVDMHLWSSHDS
jgi:acyl transferase domain-containing protein